MIEVRDLKKVYKTKKGVVVNALDGVSLKLPSVGMVFILGKSGSGKSTLLNVIGGLDSIDSGEIIVKGSSCRDFKQSHYDSYRNTYIGFIFQEYNILEELTVGANIALAIELQGRRAENDEINAILREVDLEGYGSRKPNELSGGQKQRVAIARALVKKPEIIMADEPTGALDSATGKQVFDTLKRLSRDKLVLIVSHDREFSEQYADRIIELSDGKVISDVEKADGSAEISEAEESEEAVSYNGGEISVKAGYALTEEDRININKYLKALSDGAKIKLSEKKKGSSKSAEFKPTDESRIEQKSGEFKLIKSKLSVKNAFKIGSGALKYKKFRLVFTIFLSLIAFTLFGLSDTIAAYDSIDTTTSSLIDSSVNYASFAKDVKYKYSDGGFYWDSYNTYLSRKDINEIAESTGLDIIGVYSSENMNLSVGRHIGNPEEKPKNQIIYSDTLSGLTSVDESFVENHGFSLVGSLPESVDEIVITRFIYEYFEACGFVSAVDGKTEEIKKEEDLLGRTLEFSGELGKFKIVGVLDTGFDYSRYLPLTEDNAASSMNAIVYMALMSELESAKNYSYACLGFVHQELIDKLEEEKSSSAQRFYGNIMLYRGTVGEGEDAYIKPHVYTEYVAYLSNVKDKVYWINGELSELSDNQIIMSADMLLETLNSDNEHKLYDQKILVGFEKTLSDTGRFYSLYDIIYQIKWCAAAKFAYNNYDKALDILSDAGFGSSFGSAEELMNTFADYAQFDESIMNKAGANIVRDYLDYLVKTYDLGSVIVSEEVLNSLVASYSLNGKVYYSVTEEELSSLSFLPALCDSLSDIIARKYAMEHYSDAKRYVLLSDKNALDYMTPVQVAQTYAYYLLGYKDNFAADFKPSSGAEDFDKYYCRNIFTVYRGLAENTEPLTMEWYSYMTNDKGKSENVEIVGLASGLSNDKYSAPIVFGDDTANKILGPNRDGLYSFAIANMPEGEGAVRDVVRFSKTEFEDSYRFSLRNSVTEELSFVEEILDVLGTAFLYVGIAFAVFASLMLSNFIGTSITYKKQDIGILRAIGSRSNDVFRIFFAESFIIAMINFVLSSIATGAISFLVNTVLRDEAGILITFLSFGIRQIFVLFAVSLLVAFVATFLPVRKIAKMKPIDAIKNRK